MSFLRCLPVVASLIAASQAQAVINGFSPDLRRLPVAGRIVRVITPGAKCTGTLLTDRVVLTAAHCDNPSAPLVEGFNPHSKQELDRLQASSFIAGKALSAGPALDVVVLKNYWAGALRGMAQRELGDMMLLLLKERAQLPEGAKVTLTSSDLVEEMAPLYSFGVGINDEGDPNPRGYVFGSSLRVAQRSTELDSLEQVGPRGGALCEGDSGGPVFFRTRDGAWRLVGVYSSLTYKKKWRASVRDLCGRAQMYTHTSVSWHAKAIEDGVRELYRRNGLPAEEAVIR